MTKWAGTADGGERVQAFCDNVGDSEGRLWYKASPPTLQQDGSERAKSIPPPAPSRKLRAVGGRDEKEGGFGRLRDRTFPQSQPFIRSWHLAAESCVALSLSSFTGLLYFRN